MATYDQIMELKRGINSLVTRKFGGDFDKAFSYYDFNGDGKLNRDNVSNVLADAGIGNFITRGLWVTGIMTELDTDLDGFVTKQQIQVLIS